MNFFLSVVYTKLKKFRLFFFFPPRKLGYFTQNYFFFFFLCAFFLFFVGFFNPTFWGFYYSTIMTIPKFSTRIINLLMCLYWFFPAHPQWISFLFTTTKSTSLIDRLMNLPGKQKQKKKKKNSRSDKRSFNVTISLLIILNLDWHSTAQCQIGERNRKIMLYTLPTGTACPPWSTFEILAFYSNLERRNLAPVGNMQLSQSRGRQLTSF